MHERQAQAGTFQRASLVPRASEDGQVRGCAWQLQNTLGEHPRLWVGLEGSGLFLGEANAPEVCNVKGLQQARGLVWLHGLRRARSSQAVLATTLIH